MEELINAVRDRFKSPIFGRFLLSWCIYNWKIVYLTVFIGQDKISCTKLDYIEQVLSQYRWTYGNLIVYPVLTTLALVFVEQFLVVGYNSLTSYREIIWQKIKSCLGIIRIYSRDEFLNLQKKNDILVEENKELTIKTTGLNNKIEELNIDIDSEVLTKKEYMNKHEEIERNYAKLNNEYKILKSTPPTIVMSLNNIFAGKWLLKYSISNGESGQETVEINNLDEYFANDEVCFKIRDYEYTFNDNGIIVKFDKIGFKTNVLYCKSTLKYNQEKDIFEGEEIIYQNSGTTKQYSSEVTYYRFKETVY